VKIFTRSSSLRRAQADIEWTFRLKRWRFKLQILSSTSKVPSALLVPVTVECGGS
jgi:hypothetical protein